MVMEATRCPSGEMLHWFHVSKQSNGLTCEFWRSMQQERFSIKGVARMHPPAAGMQEKVVLDESLVDPEPLPGVIREVPDA